MYPNDNMVIGGDFNAILDIKEKFGGSQIISKAISDFKEWVKENKLIEILTNNGIYTQKHPFSFNPKIRQLRVDCL